MRQLIRTIIHEATWICPNALPLAHFLVLEKEEIPCSRHVLDSASCQPWGTVQRWLWPKQPILFLNYWRFYDFRQIFWTLFQKAFLSTEYNRKSDRIDQGDLRITLLDGAKNYADDDDNVSVLCFQINKHWQSAKMRRVPPLISSQLSRSELACERVAK